MPFDSKGKYQLNNQKVAHANRMHEGAAETKDSVHMTVHDHGDGTGHTEMHDGRRVDHKDMEGHKHKLDSLAEGKSENSDNPTEEMAEMGGWD